MNNTPRTHAAWKKAYDAQELAKLMVELSVQLEVELNVATVNEAFAENKAYMLEKELKQAQDRIKERDEWNEKLDEIIDRLTEKIILLNEIRQEAGVQDANLRKKLSEANDLINRLEEAGDEMEKYIFDQTNTRFIICAIKWREAKEAKP